MPEQQNSSALMKDKLPTTLSPGAPPPPLPPPVVVHRPAPQDSHFDVMDLPGLP